MFVLDTNVISELRSGKPNPSSAVLAWAASTALSSHYLTSVTVYELELGVLHLERRKQGSGIRQWLETVKSTFRGRVLPFSDHAAVACARMHVPNPKSFRDSMIAAIALESGLTVVSRNVDDFAHTGVRLLNPWDDSRPA
jgi:predicted nucleic acid-binding protein